MAAYALPETHRDVGAVQPCGPMDSADEKKLLEEPLGEVDPEIAGLIVRFPLLLC
jgi:hypothetical protein